MFSRSTLRCLNSSSSRATVPITKTATAATRRTACLSYHSSSGASQFRATPPEIPPQAPEPSSQWQQGPPSQPQSNSGSSSSSTTSDAKPTATPKPTPTMPPSKLPQPPTFKKRLSLTPKLTMLLPQLATQPPFYITAHIHARAYLLTEGDKLRLPFLMPGVQAGDILRLNRASVLGSRDYSLKGAPYVDERLFECRLRVMGTESEPLRVKQKKKRRNRRVRTAKSKHQYTILRVMKVNVKGVEELIEEGAKISKEASE